MTRPTRLGTLFALILVGGIVAAALAGEDRPLDFVGDIEDLPLMAGLSEVPGVGMVFDTPSGRIVEAVASGPVTKAQVLGFYASTLPQLGWRQDAETVFRREGERLKLEFPASEEAGPVTVLFALSPETAADTPR